ncbi:uncharacterized protein F4822DRAFT_1563 [Hypoxylon trugodes]|uniref:uncharacterized protein n=1 Tax=Hypoxylon trugodes TaxID=326681 RepID=UPI00219E3412|nr:uncharacterized protein F4822DRAFT_1563 [Hypoxylon trugodes]KAI1393145.1 hypothetical protein F4822DRAFT_1563 [Hypoxylon trugodes]
MKVKASAPELKGKMQAGNQSKLPSVAIQPQENQPRGTKRALSASIVSQPQPTYELPDTTSAPHVAIHPRPSGHQAKKLKVGYQACTPCLHHAHDDSDEEKVIEIVDAKNAKEATTTTPPSGPPNTATMSATDPAPHGSLRSPPEGIYSTFDELIATIQRYAKEQGFGIVKLRASNYRDKKPTRYDLVCDRGGVVYKSTAKTRNPSTRKIECPWKAKAVCEVQLHNQWRFQVQVDQHNHEPRINSGNPGQENTPTAQSIRSLTNKLDRMSHDMNVAFGRIESRLDTIDKRLESMESRMSAVEARVSNMENRGTGMEVPMDNMEMTGSMLDGPVM